jgi:agmatinase
MMKKVPTRPKYSRIPSFLESEIGTPPPNACRFHVHPVPLEKTVSYGGGTSRGPDAILVASQQLELFDGIGEPGTLGIWTAPAVNCRRTVSRVFNDVRSRVTASLAAGAVPILLGGEHSLTAPAVEAAASQFSGTLGVVQFDAHADLRDAYEGSPESHACVMRRIAAVQVPFLQIGVRSVCREEAVFRRENRTAFLDAEEFAGTDTVPELPLDFLPENVYVTIDVDAFDPSVMPATGTPEPGGLSWRQMIRMLAQISERKRVVGFDVVELAPIPGLHHPEFTTAKLIYRFIGMIALN